MIISIVLSIVIVISGRIEVESALAQKQGPFEIRWKYLEHCDEELTQEAFKIEWKFNKANRSEMHINANITSQMEFGDDLKLKMELAVMTNQGWKHNYFNFDSKDGICSVLKLYGPKKFKKLMSSVVPPASDCPIPPGNYLIDIDFALERDENVVPVFVYNKYRVRNELRYGALDGPVVACIISYQSLLANQCRFRWSHQPYSCYRFVCLATRSGSDST
ncbi:Hypothetical protein NTJ_07411 [Nesidiocoris tenuis]|uniref:MD-2-related lipid-recognition domain-containing protein n=1 Tax=Nesidiocoris tenuis TaxID=355587 RepID=A0ABN7AQW6_9HEMI|nr:Hypothetical protein NTJ_07411 [Nesidiocoris tenuis]